MKATGEDSSAFAFLTCGGWDLKTCLPVQLANAGVEAQLPEIFNNERVINVKNEFRKVYGLKRAKGMKGMLDRLKIKLVGRHHSGIDDCRNIAQIVARMRKDGWSPTS